VTVVSSTGVGGVGCFTSGFIRDRRTDPLKIYGEWTNEYSKDSSSCGEH
jgi:hypothetical protein